MGSNDNVKEVCPDSLRGRLSDSRAELDRTKLRTYLIGRRLGEVMGSGYIDKSNILTRNERRQKMGTRKFFVFLTTVVVLASLSFGVSQGMAQSQATNGTVKPHNDLKDRQNASAALRKSHGMMGYTTGDDRLSAAQRNAARRAAAAKAKGQGGGK